MEFLPLFFRLQGRRCLVIGGGQVAKRKCEQLIRAGAIIQLIAQAVDADLAQMLKESGSSIAIRSYRTEDLQGQTLVIAATDDRALNQRVSNDAQSRQIPVNVVDDPALCSFILPAIIDRSPVVVAVSSGGASPVLARFLRAQIETLLPASYGRLASLLGAFRDRVKARFKDISQRRLFWEEAMAGPLPEMVFSGRERDAEHWLTQQLQRADSDYQGGEVYLVGAGPGDPDLLTFKALRLMQKADIVLYDRLVSAQIVDMTRRDAEKIYVGKQRAEHALPQQAINQLLLDYALAGKKVLRLKGGDPFIFGRGGEEIDLLAQHHIPVQVVPGVTAASGCAAYAGIPLTHRDYAQSVRFLTGHMQHGGVDCNWSELQDPRQTLVFYMGLTNLSDICSQLIAHGRSPDTPIALIQKGTTSEQRVWTATLADMPARIARETVKAPTLIIVGGVVALREKLGWV